MIDTDSSSAGPELSYESGKTLMAQGPQVLHDLMASKIQAAMGRPLPEMEVRYSNLSLSADIVVADDHATKYELPTIPNELKKTLMGPKKLTVRKEILKNVSGRFTPGKITLLLGQPGSGKSALMKVLSGRFPMGKNITMEGDVTFNGVPREQIIDRLPQFVSYVNQRDKHFPTITVKETLEFANKFCGGDLIKQGKGMLDMGAHHRDPAALEAAKAIFAHYPEIVIQQLGLQICQDTIVGDNMLRGVSGGERKRVTTGEMEFGMTYVSLMDEISTGLDSAATFDIINTQRSAAHRLHKTVVIALLQPSPEIFALFDDVMILNDGELMYHGPCDKVEAYFETLGFKCPPGRDIADYLLDLGTKQQHRYEVPHLTKQPRMPNEFGENFRLSPIYQNMVSAVEGPYDPRLVASVKDIIDPMPAFHQSISVVMGVMFATVMFLSLGQGSQIPVYIAGRDIFYKHRRANFFRTGSYVLATVSQIPLAFAETIIFGSIVYWVCGFAAEAKLFLIFEIVLFVANLAMGMWFFFLAGICPNANVVMPVGMVSVLCFIIFAGFVVTRSQIPDYLIWAHWISPIAWAIKALAVNQYRSSEFDVCVYDDVDYCSKYGRNMGEYYLNLFDFATEKEWVAYGIIYLLAIYVFFMFLSYLAMEYVRYETPETVDVSVKPVDDENNSYLLTETPKNANSKGDVIVDLPVETRGMNFVPVTVAFQDLHYWVPDPHNPKEQLELLKGINGYAVPGSITALMGSTGAGTTTLMDVIAGRKTGGKISGKIMLNGYEASDLAIRPLTFSSFLRQDASILNAKKYDSVNECIEMLGMEDIADMIIRGSSVEQMKRLTIGVELAAQPSVIFLDEPTSGLDARSAKIIMDGVRKVADSGRTIICTIHQPSAEVFYLFDRLLLLQRGGQTAFYGDLGPNCRNLIDYFENIPGVAPLPVGYNPATWMLECIGAGVGHGTNDSMDFVSYFKNSPYNQQLEATMAKEGITTPSPDLPEVMFGRSELPAR
ncbi:unnamed protein product [Phytophthora fragariaefolia]|uniref:Unnamed protein product n=1 Tax=Phytophthora fragariaefolia TaxID=1490495 RepID=A0A9W6X6B7_9STRA|nr:unnamed protein product [Phytophthora fragariaefolia]